MTDRIIVLAPSGRDAAVVVSQLELAAIEAVTATDEGLIAAIRGNKLGVAIIAAEVLDTIDMAALRAALLAQPPWSDCPILLLTRLDSTSAISRSAILEFANVTLLECPLHMHALVSATRTALRARARQRKAATYLSAQEEAEVKVRELANTLEARVVLRTTELTEEIAKRASAEARLRESEESYRFTVELSSQIPWNMAAGGKLLSMGDGWSALTGKSIEDAYAHGWRALLHPDDLELVLAARDDVLALGTPLDTECRVEAQDGGYHWCRIRASARRDPAGKIMKWYGTIENIDERRQAEARYQKLQSDLIHVSRVSAMGTMASTLAHELNQPLTAIANYVRGSRRLLDSGDSDKMPAALEAMAAADRTAVRAGEIVRRLRELVARGEVNMCPEDLPDLIREATAIALVDVGSFGIDCHLDLDPRAARVDADRIQVQQVLINLLRNAVEVLKTVAVRRIAISTRQVGNFCEICVTDSGPGIDPKIAERLFEPFNTNKTDSMGIGLSISRTIIEAHGGRIWHEPGKGRGTKFCLTLVAV
jgi:PAS domain S-box-containing protein